MSHDAPGRGAEPSRAVGDERVERVVPAAEARAHGRLEAFPPEPGREEGDALDIGERGRRELPREGVEEPIEIGGPTRGGGVGGALDAIGFGAQARGVDTFVDPAHPTTRFAANVSPQPRTSA